ncbi:MAG: hypothetical protein LQ350_004292 [Teloschistes chrysophthalmus]|nr:MAG: hypothetical protein LQ350_004292 [Niorma chrysophthalma]
MEPHRYYIGKPYHAARKSKGHSYLPLIAGIAMRQRIQTIQLATMDRIDLVYHPRKGGNPRRETNGVKDPDRLENTSFSHGSEQYQRQDYRQACGQFRPDQPAVEGLGKAEDAEELADDAGDDG